MRTDALWGAAVLGAAGIAVGAILLRKPAPAPAPAAWAVEEEAVLPSPAPARPPAPFDPYARMPDVSGDLPPPRPAAPPEVPTPSAVPPPASPVPTVLRTMSPGDGVKIQPGERPDAPVLVVDPFPEEGPVPGEKAKAPKQALRKAKEAANIKAKPKAGIGVPAQGD